MLKGICIRAGIKGVRCSPHTLRHSFAVHYLRAGGNLEYLRRILGHSNIPVTQRYLQSIQPTDTQKIHNELSPLGGKHER
jgi:site-specific recombinase XerD